jgi:hypothetical protein
MARQRRVKRILNCNPSRDTERDWRLVHADEAGLLAAAPRAAAVPQTKDLREDWWKIGDQGATGSCVGWSTADGILRWHLVKAGRLQPNQRLSVRFEWMASKETDDFVVMPTTFIEEAGTSIKNALDVARRYGCVTDAILPFGTGKLYTGRVGTFYTLAAQRRINSYYNLSLSAGHTLDQWKRWIASNGPIAVRLDVDPTWDNVGSDGNLDVYDSTSTRGGHAVLLVGYTPDRFIVRNSWGTVWGDRGFGYASLAYAQDAFTEAYGAHA